MLLIPAPIFSLAQAAWIPRITIWRDDGTMHRREGGRRDGGKLWITAEPSPETSRSLMIPEAKARIW
jgi:hypothetical protein